MNDITKYKIQNLIRIKNLISRKDISEKLDISTTAVTNYVAELIRTKEVIEVGTQKSTGGRKPISLEINKDNGRIISVDFGQKYFRAAICNMKGEILHRKEFESSKLGASNEGIEKICSILAALMDDPAAVDHRIVGIGMGISGIIDYRNGVCIKIPNLHGWDNVPFTKLLEGRFNVPVYIDDSSRLQAVAEAARNKEYKKNLIYINLGVGLGTGIIIDWRLFRGSDGLAGELGHVIVEENGLLCGCGNRGCLEQYASVPSIMRRVKKLLSQGVTSSLNGFIDNDIDSLTPEMITKACEDFDKLVYSVIIETGRYLGIGLSQIVTLFNPSSIVIGGGGSNISSDLIDEAVKTMRTRTVSRSLENIEIVKSTLGDEGTLTGAAIMALDRHFNLYDLMDDNIYTL